MGWGGIVEYWFGDHNKGQDGSDLVKAEIYFFLYSSGAKDLSVLLLRHLQNVPPPCGAGIKSQLQMSDSCYSSQQNWEGDGGAGPHFTVTQPGSCVSGLFSCSVF